MTFYYKSGEKYWPPHNGRGSMVWCEEAALAGVRLPLASQQYIINLNWFRGVKGSKTHSPVHYMPSPPAKQ